MNTERNWSSVEDYEGGNFGQRCFYTREQWVKQVEEWHFTDPVFDDVEWHTFNEMLSEMDDEELMHYIQENWSIEIRETTWLRVGNECCWRNGHRRAKILQIPEDLSLDSPILVLCEEREIYVPFGKLYGYTDKECPKCGQPLYVSDLCSYPYVCIECDENFYGIECD